MNGIPDPLHVANQAQSMARSIGDERVRLAFQSIAMISMAVMGAAAAAHMLRALLRSDHQSPERGWRGR